MREREIGRYGGAERRNGRTPGAADAAESEDFDVGFEVLGDELVELGWKVGPVDSDAAAIHGGLVLLLLLTLMRDRKSVV